MTLVVVVAAGVVCALGAYLLTAPQLSRVVIGIGLLGHGVNLVLVRSGDAGARPPFVGDRGPFTDPLPQALVLTAIVIGFAAVGLLLAMAHRRWELDGDDPVEGEGDPDGGAPDDGTVEP